MYRLRDKRRFQSKIASFPTPGVFDAPAEGVTLPIGYRRSGRNQNDWATWPIKKFDYIFSRLDTIHERGRQTDGRTVGDSKNRA